MSLTWTHCEAARVLRSACSSSYEMQVSAKAQGAGLGKVLVEECMNIAERTGMQKVIATCLKGQSVA